MTTAHRQSRTSGFRHECTICGSKAIGFNFGVSTCSPCKAFFRRNGRRREILEMPCQHDDRIICYSLIRQCSSCRLRRCFDMGMKVESIRTIEDNIRHQQLIDMNRQKKELLKQKQQEIKLQILQSIVQKNQFLDESDWRHLSNIVSAYDTQCLKTYIQQRSSVFINETKSYEYMPIKNCPVLSMSLSASLYSFLRSLPAFHSLPQINQTYLTKTNLRSLLFPNLIELSQTCYSEPWQKSLDKATWQLICGSEIYEQFTRTENLAQKTLVADSTVTRLWLIILFFSSSLFCLYDSKVSIKTPKNKTVVSKIQNAYITLLWNYLLHRYGDLSAIHIYSNLIHVYLKMQRVGFDIGIRVRTRNELLITHETLNQLSRLDICDS